VNEERRARLWNATAAREREILEEEISGDERAGRRNDDTAPARAAGRIHESRQSPREKNEGDDYEAHESADYEAEEEGEAILLAAEVLDHSHQTRWQSPDFYGWHVLKLNASTSPSKRLAHAKMSRARQDAMAWLPSVR
jgi:hypothetical protein